MVNKSNIVSKFVIDIKAKATIKSFAPTIFMKLRSIHGITETDIITSLDPINNREQIFKSNLQTSSGVSSNVGGKSGSFFFFSEDK